MDSVVSASCRGLTTRAQSSLDLRKSVGFNTRRETQAALSEVPRSPTLVHRAPRSQEHGSSGRRSFIADARHRTAEYAADEAHGIVWRWVGGAGHWANRRLGLRHVRLTELWSNGFQQLMHNPEKGVHFIDATQPRAAR